MLQNTINTWQYPVEFISEYSLQNYENTILIVAKVEKQLYKTYSIALWL